MNWMELLQSVLIVLIIPGRSKAMTFDMKYIVLKKEVVCRDSAGFGEICPEEVMEEDLEMHKELILDLHNAKRMDVADGEYSPAPAARMSEMYWDDKLAKLALWNAKTCLDTNICNSTKQFKVSGQNRFRKSYPPVEMDTPIEEIIMDAMYTWEESINDLDLDHLRKYPETPFKGKEIALWITDHNTHVGCAAVRYATDDDAVAIIVCNYSCANVPGEQVVRFAYKAASQCPNGVSQRYPALCKYSEAYKIKGKLKQSAVQSLKQFSHLLHA